jgi:hypothetical protein
MARKQSNTVDYFPHFAKWGKTIPILKGKWGNEGYAVWFQILELLCAEDGHYYDCRQVDNWQFLLARIGVSEAVARDILDLLAQLGNIDRPLWGHGIIWCQNLIENLGPVYQNRRRNAPVKPNFATGELISTCRNTTAAPISTRKKRQSKVKQSKVKNTTPSKEGARKRPTNNKKDATIKEIFQEMQEYLGFPEKVKQDPIPNYGKEGQFIKRMLARGFTREAIVGCWKSKVSQRGGGFISMTWVNEDIGKPEKQRGARRLSTDAEIAASIKEATTWHGDN